MALDQPGPRIFIHIQCHPTRTILHLGLHKTPGQVVDVLIHNLVTFWKGTIKGCEETYVNRYHVQVYNLENNCRYRCMKFHDVCIERRGKRSNDCLVDVSPLNHNQLCPKHMVTSKKIDLMTVFALFWPAIGFSNRFHVRMTQDYPKFRKWWTSLSRRQACMADKNMYPALSGAWVGCP